MHLGCSPALRVSRNMEFVQTPIRSAIAESAGVQEALLLSEVARNRQCRKMRERAGRDRRLWANLIASPDARQRRLPNLAQRRAPHVSRQQRNRLRSRAVRQEPQPWRRDRDSRLLTGAKLIMLEDGRTG